MTQGACAAGLASGWLCGRWSVPGHSWSSPSSSSILLFPPPPFLAFVSSTQPVCTPGSLPRHPDVGLARAAVSVASVPRASSMLTPQQQKDQDYRSVASALGVTNIT